VRLFYCLLQPTNVFVHLLVVIQNSKIYTEHMLK